MAVGEKRSVVMGAEKAAPNGVATLGADGKLEENQRPVYTGEDIHVSEEDNTDMSTALSNKADKYPVLDIPADTSTPADYPQGLSIVNGDGGVYLTVVGLNEWRALQFYGAENEGLYYRVNNSGQPVGWTSLLKVATATPPEESDLPLVDGWTNVDRSTYFKMQNNVVVLTLSAQYISGAVTGESHVATLPEGYRPTKTIPALCGIGELGSTTGYIKVDASGNVFFGAGEQSINKVFAQILFIGS